ncbi:hypothetical protein T12_4427 [Trichinella patagoniensis]|uniref:Uncharacterized protein n=1 Tax=Trichinella patagoniensis TaxID=990121 RepID=A0A0V0YT47_9BILA|nr:hypothetical protein T12_4427 [Trichinella patagoniensis]
MLFTAAVNRPYLHKSQMYCARCGEKRFTCAG